MSIDAIPLFAMLKGRMGYLTQRQSIVAQNVANTSTPGYTPKDLKPFSLDPQAKVVPAARPAVTHAMHVAPAMPALPGGSAPGGWKAVDTPDSETNLNGNQVVLEEQMMKMTEARMNYDAAISFYQKSMNLLRMAARAPGR